MTTEDIGKCSNVVRKEMMGTYDSGNVCIENGAGNTELFVGFK